MSLPVGPFKRDPYSKTALRTDDFLRALPSRGGWIVEYRGEYLGEVKRLKAGWRIDALHKVTSGRTYDLLVRATELLDAYLSGGPVSEEACTCNGGMREASRGARTGRGHQIFVSLRNWQDPSQGYTASLMRGGRIVDSIDGDSHDEVLAAARKAWPGASVVRVVGESASLAEWRVLYGSDQVDDARSRREAIEIARASNRSGHPARVQRYESGSADEPGDWFTDPKATREAQDTDPRLQRR